MKHLTLVLIIFSFFTFAYCKKNNVRKDGLSTIVVTNAVVTGSSIKLNTNLSDSAKTYNSKNFGLSAGENEILLLPTTGSKIPFYNNFQTMEAGKIYSLFLSGKPSAIDAVYIEENIPEYYEDSTLGIRIINLSPNSTPLNITLESSPSINVFSRIAYKQLTDFIKIPLPSIVPTKTVTFQVRGAGNNLLTSFVLPPTVTNTNYPNISILNSRNRNITLVIKGIQGTTTGDDAFGVFPVANY
jgi:hypothetical protein